MDGKISKLKEKMLKLKNNCEKEGISEAERSSIRQVIIPLANRLKALNSLYAALTNKGVQIISKVGAGIVHDHLRLTNCT